MTTESIKDKAEFDTEVDLLTAAAARADELEAKAAKMLAAIGLTPDPQTTAVRQVVKYLQDDLTAHFRREGLSQPSGDGLQLGDVVRLRSGGPTMTINSYSTECCVDDLAVKCAWFVDRDNVGRFAEQVQSHSFAAAALVKVGGASSLPSIADACDPNKVTTIEVVGDLCGIGKPWRDAVAKLAEEAVQFVRRGVYGVCIGYYTKQNNKMAPDMVVSSEPFTAAQLREHIRKGSIVEADAAMEEGEKVRLFLTLRVAAAKPTAAAPA